MQNLELTTLLWNIVLIITEYIDLAKRSSHKMLIIQY